MALKALGASTFAFCGILVADLGLLSLGAEVCSDQSVEACGDDATSALLQTRVTSEPLHQQLQQQQQQQQQRQQQQQQQQMPEPERRRQQLERILERLKKLTRQTLSDAEHRVLERLREAFKTKEETLPNKPTSDEMLWGGPSVAFTEMGYTIKNFSLAEATAVMNCPGPESGLPEDFQGIFWMDQYGKSSVGQDPNYPFAMFGTGETLMSFSGSAWEADSKCVTPTPVYLGRGWAYFNDGNGEFTFEQHNSTRNVLSFCYLDEGEAVLIRSKQLKEYAAVGPLSLGAWFADLMEFQDAGNGYVWEPTWLVDMSMVKKPWGWDRVTSIVSEFDGPEDSPLFEFFTWLAESLLPVSHYPLLQIVDGHGEKTKYYYEVEATLANSALPARSYFIPQAKSIAE